MNQFLPFYFVGAPIGAMVCGVLCWVLVQRLSWEKAWALVLFLVGSVGILVCSTAELAQTSEGNLHAWSVAAYAFIALGPVTWFFFALTYWQTTRGRRSPRLVLLLVLCLIPLVTTVLVAANPTLGLVWTATHMEPSGGFLVRIVDGYGPWFWVHVVYSYGLSILGSVLFLAFPLLRFPHLWEDSMLVMAAGLLPLAFNLIYIFRVIPGLTRDFSALALPFSGAIFTWGLVRIRRRAEEARRELGLQHRFSVGLVVVGPGRRLVDGNDRGLELLRPWGEPTLGAPLDGPLPQAEEDVLWPHPSGSGACRLRRLSQETDRQGGATVFHIEPIQGDVPKALTPRELELAALVAQGLSNKEIAAELHLSELTVKTHVHRILTKLGKVSRRELTLPLT